MRQSPGQNAHPRRVQSRAVRLTAVMLATLLFALPGCLDNLTGGLDPPGPHDYVSDDKYTRWVIELDVTDGESVPSSAINLLQSRLNEVASKPGGIVIQRDDTLPRRGGTWTQDDVLKTHERTQDVHTGDGTVTLHLLILDGTYEDSNVLGVTYLQKTKSGKVVSSGPIAIFSDSVAGACDLLCLTTTDAIWQAVLVHEFGHAMGLVNEGAPMQRNHEDAGHPGHSSNTNSVMYYAVEDVSVANVFRNGPPTTFDADDKADLCALGGKC